MFGGSRSAGRTARGGRARESADQSPCLFGVRDGSGTVSEGLWNRHLPLRLDTAAAVNGVFARAFSRRLRASSALGKRRCLLPAIQQVSRLQGPGEPKCTVGVPCSPAGRSI